MPDLLDQLERSFNRERVSIVEFAESPKFCNKVLYPRQRLLLKLFFLEDLTDVEEAVLDHWIAGGYKGEEIEISPNIRERIQYCKDNGYQHFREIVLVGGRRCSKGFLTGITMAKLAFDLLQLQDPQNYYGIDPGKEIVFSVVAAAQEQAKDMQYADFASSVNSCMAMQRNIFKLQELEFSLMTEKDIREVEGWKRQGRRVQKDTSSIRGKAMAANARTIRGSASMAIVFDEYAHFMQGENDQSDGEIYAAATPALAQFGTAGMLFCNSSPYSKVGKFYERYEVGMAIEDGQAVSPNVLSLRFPSWALFEGWWDDPDYAGAKKCITVSPDWDLERKLEDPITGEKTEEFFYTKEDREAIKQERGLERDDPIKYKVERRGYFAEVIDAYLDADKVDRMFAGRPIFDELEGGLTYYPYNVNWNDSTNIYEYVAHIDPSSTTAGFGFALGHIEHYRLPVEDPETEEVTMQAQAHVVFDIIKRWDPKVFPEKTISWEPILDELLNWIWLFRPKSLTFDQHQSVWPIQWLQKETKHRGLNDCRIFEKTADLTRNWNRAEIFRTSLYHGRIHAPSDTWDCEWAGQELKYLQEIKTARLPRVEKQDTGPVQTKDVADCIMEVVETLIGSEFDRSEGLLAPLAVGAAGGFRIGGDRELPEPMQELYGRRPGEKARNRTANNPARRAFGGKPIPRALPYRRLPGR